MECPKPQPTEQALCFHIFQLSSRGYGARNMHNGGMVHNYFLRSFPCCTCLVLHIHFVLTRKKTKFYRLFCSLLEPTPRVQCTIVQCDLDVIFTLIILCCNHCLDQLISAIFLHGIYWIKLPAPQDKKLGEH